MIFAPNKIGVAHDGFLEGDGGLNARDEVFAECATHSGDGVFAGRAHGDDFGDHRVIVWGDGVACVGVGIDADAASTWGIIEVNFSWAGLKIAEGIFGIDAAFYGVILQLGVVHVLRKGFASGDLDLLFDEINAVGFLSDAVFHLDAGIHLHEVVVSMVIHEAFDGAGADVADFFGEADAICAHAFADFVGHDGGGSFFDNFLVATLHGAVAFAEVDDIAVHIGHDLELDVVGIFDEFFEINGGVSERFVGFVSGGMVTGDERAIVVGGAHSAATATSGGFDHHGIAHGSGDLEGFFFGVDDAIGAWGDGHSRAASGFSGGIFVTHGADGAGWRADEFDITAFADLGEVGIFAEETVAWMNGIDIADFCGADDAIDFQIGLGAGGWADADGFVGELDVERIDIGFGVNGESFDAEFFAGADDAESDFASIGDENFFKHGRASAA